MIRTLIVDDERLARDKLRRFLAEIADVEVAGECASGAEAIAAIRDGAVDLVLLDVQMPEIDGFAVLRAIGAERCPAIVFVTAHDEHAVRAFEVAAIDYLLKPFTRRRLELALDRVRERLGRADPRLAALLDQLGERHLERILVRAGERMVPVRVEEIERFEADDNYVRVHVAAGGEHLIRDQLSRLETRLDPRRFVRVHRSHLVAVDAIRELRPLFHGEHEVVMRGGGVLPVGRRYRDRLLAVLGDR